MSNFPACDEVDLALRRLRTGGPNKWAHTFGGLEHCAYGLLACMTQRWKARSIAWIGRDDVVGTFSEYLLVKHDGDRIASDLARDLVTVGNVLDWCDARRTVLVHNPLRPRQPWSKSWPNQIPRSLPGGWWWLGKYVSEWDRKLAGFTRARCDYQYRPTEQHLVLSERIAALNPMYGGRIIRRGGAPGARS